MARLPQPGSDSGTWGNILNEFLQVAHNSDGTLQPISNAAIADGTITSSKLVNGTITGAKIANNTITDSNIANANIDGAAGTPSLRTLGTGPNQAMPGDATITPGAHAASHRGNGSDPIAVASTTVSGLMSNTDKTKLDSVAANATANSSDAFLRDRANHTGSQAQSTITDLTSDLADKYEKPGTGIPESDLSSAVQTKLNLASDVTSVNTKNGDVVLTQDDIEDGTTFKQYSQTEKTKLAGIANNATANDTDINLRDRTTHTGFQAQSTITNLVNDLAGKQPIDGDLTDISALSAVNDDILQRKGGEWTNRTPAQLKLDLGLVKSDVGLGNVDNTSDANKPISTATQTALNLKEDAANKSASTSLGTSNTLFPTQNAVKTYVDTAVAGVTVADGDKGDITVSSSGTSWTIDSGVITDAKVASGANIAQSKIANLTTDLANKQALDADLTAIASLTPTDDDIIQRKAGAWTNRTTGQLKSDLSLSKSDVGLSNVDNTSDTTKNSATATLTNKRITPRVTTITSSATPTINTDDCDAVTITALATAITSMTTNLSGSPTNFQKLIIRIKDDGTARAITWGASFEAKGVSLPTTTVISKVLTVGFIYDTVTSKWGCVASVQEA